MKIVEEKLERFANDIMNDVQSQKKEILGSVIEANKVEFDKKQTEYLNENYHIVQNSLKKIDKEKNEIMSKVIMDNRMKLLNKRSEVINQSFELAKAKLLEHTQENGYLEELIQDIKACIQEIGQGEIEIIISYTDQRLIEDLKKVFGDCISVENKNIEMIGGCKILNSTARLFIDDSYANRLENQRLTFLQNCNIHVEM